MTRRMSVPEYEARSGIVPIPIRADLIVRVHGLPADLTVAEAQKIANVVQALASEGDMG